MSVRFALTIQDVTYFIADMKPDISKETFTLEQINVKRYPSGVLFAYQRSNVITDYIRTHPDLLRHTKKFPLSRYHLVSNFTKNIRQLIIDERLSDIYESIEDNCYFIATPHKLFQIFDQYRILTVVDYVSYGPYEDIVFEYLQTHDVTLKTTHHIKIIMELLNQLFTDIYDRFVIINTINKDLIFKEDIK